jgi:hypothetical protein
MDLIVPSGKLEMLLQLGLDCFLPYPFPSIVHLSSYPQTLCDCNTETSITEKKTPWPESASELYRQSDRRLSAKWLPTFAERGCHVVSVTDPYGRILGFSRQDPLLFYQIAPQLYSRGWVHPVPDPLLFSSITEHPQNRQRSAPNGTYPTSYTTQSPAPQQNSVLADTNHTALLFI